MNRLLGILLITLFGVMTLKAQPAPCDATDGKGVIACVAARYPERLVAGVSLEQRQANMAFLRDRVIETARCAKIDVGLNCKRGNCNSISYDFIAWRNGGRVEGVDIAAGYDDISVPLRLMWHTYDREKPPNGPPNYGFPTYKPYGPVSCVIDPEPPPVPPTQPPVQSELDALKAEITAIKAALVTFSDAFNNNATVLNTLKTEFENEQTNRKAVDDEHNKQLDVLKSRPIYSGCTVQFGIRCRLVE